MAALWLRLLLAIGLPVAAVVAVVFLVYRRRSLPRNAPPELPEVSPTGGGAEPATASPGLAKLNMRYTAASGRVGLRFQQLHQHQHHHARLHRGSGGGGAPFQWADHPRLVTEAAENGWAQFVFAVAPPLRSKSSASSSPLWGTCPLCDAGTSRDMADAAAWELPAGSAERVQAVRLNPATAAAASSRKWLPGSIPSPLRGEADAAAGALCLARMSLPLPGPPLAGAPFPQDAYFEITIIYLNTKRPEWSASRASRRGGRENGTRDNSDRVKLISFAPDTNNNPVQLQQTTAAAAANDAAADEQQDNNNNNKRRHQHHHQVMSIGLAAASAAPHRPSLPGTYASSIGFHSDGAVYLDGMKLVYESDKSAWAGVDRVVGCGFEPARRKVFFTVDGRAAHAVSCNAEAFASPMYPVLASGFDVMALVNLGQGKFRYAPANARRTANPCFVRAASGVDGRGAGSGSMGGMGMDFDGSGELFSFSMGRVDSGWLETAAKVGRSRKESIGGGGGSGAVSVGEPEAESDLFEIPLRD